MYALAVPAVIVSLVLLIGGKPWHPWLAGFLYATWAILGHVVDIARPFWRRKPQGRTGRPAIAEEHIDFIRRISADHPEYGEDRITLESEVKFAVWHASSTVRRYMVKRRPPSDSQAWRSFRRTRPRPCGPVTSLYNTRSDFVCSYVFVIMEISSRKLIRFNVTEHPTLEWTKQQVRNACFEEQPKFLIHDNDGKFGQLGRPARVER